MKNLDQTRPKKKFSLKQIARLITIILIGIVLVIGIIFSSSSFADNYILGQDFSDKYQAWVGVFNSKGEERPNDDNQPNGDAEAGAKILATRLNPLGMKDIRVSQAGKNYLQVTVSSNSYNNVEEFKNTIQRSGSVIMTDNTFNDIQFSSTNDDSKIERTPMSDYFKSAKADTIANGTQKNPYISYELNGSKFSDLVSSKTAADDQGQAQEFDMFIFTDLDELFNDVRTYFNFDKDTKIENRYDDFFTNILQPLRDIYNNNDNSVSDVVKDMLYDMFYGTWENTTGNNITTEGGSLMDSSIEINEIRPTKGANIKKIFDSGFKYTSKTANYVYSGDATTDDFDDDGRYAQPLTLHKAPKGSKPTVKEAFSSLSTTVLPAILGNKDKDIAKYFQENYVLFNGAVATDAQKNTSAYFDQDHFYTQMDSQTKATIDASIFNAASAGFSFVSSSVSEIKSPISQVELIISMMIILILLVALFVLMFILYRFLALFTIIIAATTVAISLLIMSLFGLTIGLESIIGSIILIAMSFEISSMLFGIARHNFYNKKRGIKTSFRIAVKESIGFGIDLAVAIIISSVCLFWIGTNTLKSLATLLSIGSALTIFFTILVGSLWMLMLVNTNIFEKAKWLFMINIDTNSSFAYQEYKIGALVAKRDRLPENVALNDRINRLEEKLKAKTEKQDEFLRNQDEKQIVKIDKRIEKIKNAIALLKTKKVSEKVIAANTKKIASYDEAMKKIREEISTLNKETDFKKISKLNSKIDSIELKIELSKQENDISPKTQTKIKRLELRIDDLNYMRSAEGREIKVENDEVSDDAYSTVEKRRIKQNERVMKLGSKILLAIFACFIALFAIIMPTAGVKLDKSFGGAVVYTVWGNAYFNNADSTLASINTDSDYSAEYKNMAGELNKRISGINDPDNNNSEYAITTARLFGEFLVYTLEHKEAYHSDLFNKLNAPSEIHYSVSSGINYLNNTSVDSNENNSNMWISLEATVPNVSGSRFVKNVITKLIDSTETNPVGADSGFTSKRLHPYTNKLMLFQALIVGGLSILILLIYIIVRFKWTYYVALALSTIMSFLMLVASLVIFRIEIDLSTITLGSIGYIIAIYLGMFVISNLRSVMGRKNEKSLTKYFEKEINVSVEIKKERRRVREEIYRKKQAMNVDIKLRKSQLSKVEILAMKEEQKQFAHKCMAEFKDYKRKKRDEVRRESRRNNYLYEVVSEVFTKLWKKLLVLLIAIVVITVALIIGLTNNWSNAFIILISFVIAGASNLFILIPLWVVIERIRIHNRLASKRFINQIVVSQEEQMIEDIND
jgi:SecD/SecF fusion protein